VQALIDASLASIMRDTATMAREAAAEALKALTPTLLNVSVNAAPVVALGMVHEQTPRIIRALARGDHVYLYGPAGSGKTTMGQKAAEAFGLQFYMVAQVEDQYALLGFTIPNPTSPTGYDVVRTQFREAFEHGGLLLWDELDRSGAGAVTAINAALANGFCAFPDGLVYMHPDFKLIAAGNTTMRGASNLYAAAQQQDASVLDRFAFIPFGYDAHIEDSHPQATDKDWVAYVRAVRQAASESGLDVVVSPRATYRGCVALASGETWDDVAETYLFKGIDPAWEAQLRKAARHAWKG
jgi:cobaltochelatase CobS